MDWSKSRIAPSQSRCDFQHFATRELTAGASVKFHILKRHLVKFTHL
jgi:hypothetical protein